MLGVSRYLSLTAAGSSANASFGAVSGVVVEVTQSGGAPCALLATHPAGKAGATTPSKFSESEPHGEPVAVAVAVGVGDAAPVDVAVAVGVVEGVPQVCIT